MIKYAWIAKVKKGCLEEYIRRHDQIWQEMKDVLKEASIRNYTIWTDGEQLFGYYECEKGIEHALKVQKESPIVTRWNEYMKDIMVMEIKEDGGQPDLKKVFEFD